MKIINPTEISGKIMNLFDEANKFVVVISPYYKFSYWKKLNRILENARKRNVHFIFFVRAGEFEDILQIKNIGYEPHLIEGLHAKIYFNERQAIISSMNLNQGSDNNSLDIGLQTETETEYKDVISFYEKFIKSRTLNQSNENFDYVNEHRTKGSCINEIHVEESQIFFCDPWEDIVNQVQNISGKSFRIYFDEGSITINGPNRYHVFIAYERNSFLRINCILSAKELDYFKSNPSVMPEAKMKIELQEGRKGYYNLIWGTLQNVQSNSVYEIIQHEEDLIKSCVVEFVTTVEKSKDLIYKLK
jgi:hypothetical protein